VKNYAVGVTSPLPSPAPEPSDAAATLGGQDVVELHIEGMHCASCVALIEESLTEQAGVSDAAVDLESARAVVRFDPTLVGTDELRAAIVEAGYAATPVS